MGEWMGSSQSASGRWLNLAKARVPDDELRARRLAARRARGVRSARDKQRCLPMARQVLGVLTEELGKEGIDRQPKSFLACPTCPTSIAC